MQPVQYDTNWTEETKSTLGQHQMLGYLLQQMENFSIFSMQKYSTRNCEKDLQKEDSLDEPLQCPIRNKKKHTNQNPFILIEHKRYLEINNT